MAGALRTAWRALRALRYFGLSRACPFCGSRLRSMLAFGQDLPVLQELQVVGAGRRRDGLCPICFASDRERLLLLFLRRRTRLFSESSRLLHVAAERRLGALLARQPNITYVSGDRYDAAGVRLDVRRLPFPDACFDALICNHVLEHVNEDLEAMRELRRVLRVGGWAVLQVPIGLALAATVEDSRVSSEAEREVCFGQKDHVRIYGPDYPRRLEAAGFRVCVEDFARELGTEAERFGLDPRESVFLARAEDRA